MAQGSSRPLTIVIAFVISLAVGFAAVTWLIGSGGPRVATSAIGGAFSLIDQNGSVVTEQSLKGRPTLIFFGYTHCPDVCPTSLFEMSEVLRALGPDADKVNAYFVSIDPERDTPAVLKNYLGSFDPHLKALSGDAAAIAATMKAYRVYAKKIPLKDGDYSMDHTAMIYLMNRDGQFVAPFNLKRRPEEAAADLRRYF